jgi:RNA polymerase sigma-70 factor (ECF subfamily)
LVFEATALPYLDDLYGFAVRLSRNRRDAEDLVQETCLRAFAAWSSFEPGSNARSWMFRILTNTFINGYRRARRAETLPAEEVATAAYSPHARQAAEDPESLVGDELLRAEVSRALASLPDEFRCVVVLCDVEGFAYREIAEIMGCPVGTVMSRLSRARRRLQTELRAIAREHGLPAVELAA